MKEWFLAKEIAGLVGLPKSPSNVTRLGTQKSWKKRQVEGTRGITYEYHLHSLPPETQQVLRLRAALEIVPIAKMPEQKPNAELARKLNEASDKARDKAKSQAVKPLLSKKRGTFF